MNFIVWLVVGGLIGWVASMIWKTASRQSALLKIVAGVVVAMLGCWPPQCRDLAGQH